MQRKEVSFCCYVFLHFNQELQKEKNSLTVQLDQSSRCLTQLEEEKKKTEQTLKSTQGLLDVLKGKIVQTSERFGEMYVLLFSSNVVITISFLRQIRGAGRRAEENVGQIRTSDSNIWTRAAEHEKDTL